MEYTATLTLGDWSDVVAVRGVLEDPDDELPDLYVLDGLSSSWDGPVDLFPGQPEATTVSFTFYVPDVLRTPDVFQGIEVRLVVVSDDWNPAEHEEPFYSFAGSATDIEARVLRGGMSFSIVAVDHREKLGEEKVTTAFGIGGAAVAWQDRWETLALAATLNLDPTPYGDVPPPYGTPSSLRGQEVDDTEETTLAQVVADALSDSVTWVGIADARLLGRPWFLRGTQEEWRRPILCVDYSAETLWFRLGMVRSGYAAPSGVPYRYVPATGERVLRLGELDPAADGVLLIDAGSVDRGSIVWRQDKTRNMNTLRLEGSFEAFTLDPQAQPWFWDAVEVRQIRSQREQGKIMRSKTSLAPSEPDARLVAYSYLGTHETERRRYSLDSLVVDVRDLPDALLPRAFDPPQGHLRPAYGRFVFLHNVDPRWNLHDRAEFPGRLVGASLTITGGRAKLELRVLWAIPTPNGDVDEEGGPSGPSGTVTIGELGTIPIGDLELTPEDFRLTASP